jgi:hypothetical protein
MGLETGMNAPETRYPALPIKSTIALIYAGSLVVAGLMLVAACAGLGYSAAVYRPEALRQSFVPNDAVMLLVGLPILLACMALARRGRLLGLLGWPGALFFVFYNYAAYVFAMPFGWAFLLHLALATVSAYSLIGLLSAIDGNAVRQKLSGAVPERVGGAVLAGLGLLFFLRVIGVLVYALISGAELAKTDLAVNVSDFVTTPAWVIGGLLLWRRTALAYVAGLGLLFQGSLLFVALIIFLLLQPLLTGSPLAVVDIAVIAVMGLICFVPFARYARGVNAKG